MYMTMRPVRCQAFRCQAAGALILTLVLSAACYGQRRRAVQNPAPLPPVIDTNIHPTFVGELKSLSKKQFYLAMENGAALKFYVTGKTSILDGTKKLKIAELHDGERVAVDGGLASDGSYNAVIIKVQPEAESHPELKTRTSADPPPPGAPPPPDAPPHD